jgi:cobalt/nickel transport protein
VDAFAADEGWDAMVGFPVEIQPLTRPYGLYAGNLFSGVVTRDGAPVPFAEVEVEYRSEGAIAAPEDVFITQVLRADANGTFHYAMPRAGWWGFAALLEGPEPMTNPEGAQVPVEQGALLWVNAVAMPTPAR